MSHALWPLQRVKVYKSIEGSRVLEIGGNKTCATAIPFAESGADSVVVTGLYHVDQSEPSKHVRVGLQCLNAFDIEKEFGGSAFDVVYGINILEHIPNTDELLRQIYSVLRPGGIAYLQGGPVWSSPRGHHIWLTAWDDKVSQNYFFSPYPGAKSVNPIPNWAHLLLTSEQLGNKLKKDGLPAYDIEKIIEWVFLRENINRYTSRDILEAVSRSSFTSLETNRQFLHEVPETIQKKLRAAYGDGHNFGAGGLECVLIKNTG